MGQNLNRAVTGNEGSLNCTEETNHFTELFGYLEDVQSCENQPFKSMEELTSYQQSIFDSFKNR